MSTPPGRAAPHLRPKPNAQCPVCGGPNACAPAACGSFEVDCWCSSVVVDPAALERVPEALRGEACLCPGCAGVSPPRR